MPSFTQEEHAYLQELIDREKIRDCLARYSTGIDRIDEEMIRSSYWPDAHDVHGDFEGSGEEFVQWVMPALKNLVRTQHYIGNSLIRIEGHIAKVQSYTQNWHTLRDERGGEYDVIQGGRYLDRFEKRGAEWRIIDRFCMFDWVAERPKSVDMSGSILGNRVESIRKATSQRGTSDQLYRFLGGLPTAGYFDVQ